MNALSTLFPLSVLAARSRRMALTVLAVTTAALLTTGCSRERAKTARAAFEPAVEYNATRGLKFSSVSSTFIGLALADFAGRLPADAVLRTVQGTFVYVENGGWLLRTPVTLESAATTGAVALKDGLYEGDRVVTKGVRAIWLAELHFLRAGQACAHEG